ncbi:C6 zinc finger domain-containing protein [Xylariaceae sp. FL0255]|nr:C6 zinc finger domain-containing protein [Xylariaceae sp. FL0255]
MTETKPPPPQARSVADAPARKKFAVPPVKIACLSCRASRTRCNGEHPCASCVMKDRECVYKPSRRGGPRIRKKSRHASEYQDLAASLPTTTEELPQHELLIPEYIGPGAGLKSLADMWQDSDTLYDHLFQIPLIDAPVNNQSPIARTYGNDDQAILNAYYIWIHPYFPIFPPPEQVPNPDRPIALPEDQLDGFPEPLSAISLAISAILALIPCPQDPNPMSEPSIRWRRTYAQFLAKTALESIENENERPESSTDPSKALDDSDDDDFREKFHSRVPIELESVIALDILSVYEYAQRGNLKKMQARAGAALVAATSMHLHAEPEVEDEYTEARRRAWWMTYICVCQGSIVSNTTPTFDIISPRYSARLPAIQADPEAWPIFLQSQRAILAATQFVIEFNRTRKAGTSMARISKRMQELEQQLEPMIRATNDWATNCPLTQPVDSNEAVLGHALRCMSRIKINSARIKVHRYCAFFDIAVFTGKHCDLASLPKQTDSSEPQQLRACCVNTLGSPHSAGSHSNRSLSPSVAASDSPSPRTSANGANGIAITPATVFPEFPFSSHESSKICLFSALNIAQGFDLMPYPNPSGQLSLSETARSLGSGSTFITPRTMPSFACCAMQCSYALLMIKNQTENSYPNGANLVYVENLRDRLQQGLFSVLATLENYATAFEALGGMRDQIRDKVNLSLDLGF